jgi:hypothetical protein
VNPGVHSVPVDSEHLDFGAGGTSVTEVLFLDPAVLTATGKLSSIVAERGINIAERGIIAIERGG